MSSRSSRVVLAGGRPVVVVAVAGALLCAAAGVLPWSSRGAGSALAPFELGQVVLAGGLGARVPRVAGVVAFAPWLAAALLMVAAASPRARRATGSVAAVLAVVPLAVVLVLPGGGLGRADAGALAASVGVVAAVLVAASPRGRRARWTPPGPRARAALVRASRPAGAGRPSWRA